MVHLKVIRIKYFVLCSFIIWKYTTLPFIHSFSKIDTFYTVSHEGGGYRLLRPRFVANDVQLTSNG